MVTEFGIFCRRFRALKGEKMQDMADKLHVTISCLSAVENGKRRITEELRNNIVKIYKLNEKETENLIKSVIDTEGEIRIRIPKDNLRMKRAVLRLLKDEVSV